MESILLVGTPGAGSSELLEALQCRPTAHDSLRDLHKLQLDTKYYTADLLLRTVDTKHKLSSQPEALLLVFDASDKSSFTSTCKWSEQHDADDIEIKLVIANKADKLQSASGTVRPQWLEQAINWCFENGYEYIETAASHPAIDRQLQLDGDPQGVARVLAALQAHMWPGMVEKEWRSAASASRTQQKGPAPSSTAHTAVDIPNSNSSSNAGEVRDQATTHQAADSSEGRVPGGDQPSNHEQQQQQQQSPGTQINIAAAGTEVSNMAAAADDDSGGKELKQQQRQRQPVKSGSRDATQDQDSYLEDLDLDDFEKLMKQAQGVRARLSGMPDADRRAAAAEMALKLAAMMGLGDSSEEGSE